MGFEVVVDLETLSCEANAVIVAIGAVALKRNDDYHDLLKPHRHFYQNIAIGTCIEAGLHLDGRTIEWWLSQSDAARSALLVDKATLKHGLHLFKEWMGDLSVTNEFRSTDGSPALQGIWGNGAVFDNVILKSAFKAAFKNMATDCLPWGHKQDMCYRTARRLFPQVIAEKQSPDFVAHHALQDALYEAQHLLKIFKHIDRRI